MTPLVSNPELVYRPPIERLLCEAPTKPGDKDNWEGFEQWLANERVNAWDCWFKLSWLEVYMYPTPVPAKPKNFVERIKAINPRRMFP